MLVAQTYLCRGQICVGLDLEEVEVKMLRDKGYNVIHGDATSTDIGRQFNAIVAGEIIEHIDNLGLFLKNMRKHLTSDGFLVISTPNVFSPFIFWNPYLVHLIRDGIPSMSNGTATLHWKIS